MVAVSGRPPPVSIEDLAEPRFDPATEQLRAAMTAMAPECPIEPDALCATASQQVGLGDFGDARFGVESRRAL